MILYRQHKSIEDLKQIYGEDLRAHLTQELTLLDNMAKLKIQNPQILEYSFKQNKN